MKSVRISPAVPLHTISTPKHGWWFLFLPVFCAALCCTPLLAQKNLAGEEELQQRLEKLDTVGSVMMIAAHPDDENTALLAYFARGRHVRTAYLSLTRGEGGQNLIGPEQGDALGIIRTQELLAARKIDGAEQYFTRAIDFGFSKTVADTFAHWPREKVLGDIVWDIRRFQPDVIILRFSGTPRDGHGQHQVSAILGREAFSAAADPTRYPEQLQRVQPWQAKRLMYNVIAFTKEQDAEAEKMADRIVIDVGQYNPELGYSYAEIAGMSRSQHRSQGMGAPEQKGSQKQYLVTIAGDKATRDVFDGIDITWSRVPGGDRIEAPLKKRDFAAAYPLIAALKDPLRDIKLKELREAWAESEGLWLDASSDKYAVTPGGSTKVTLTALERLQQHVTLTGADISGTAVSVATSVLPLNEPSRFTHSFAFPATEAYSQPYWLVLPKDGWLYSVPDPREIGDPENPPLLEAHFKIRIDGTDLDYPRPVQYRYVDHLYGETVRPLAVVPVVAVNFAQTALVFPNTDARHVEIPLRSNAGKNSGDVRLTAPEGWRVEPASRHFDLGGTGQETTAAFDVTPPSADAQAELRAVATVGDREISVGTQVIDYPHIPAQTLFPLAATKVVRADIRTLSKNIGYITGAGDEVPGAIRQMGASVSIIENLATADFSRFDAVVTGVRAFNTRADLRANYERLFQYVQDGGTLVVQYNVPEGGPFGGDPALLEHVGPFPITISRERVTDTNSAVVFPNPELPVLHAPNQITERDFTGWVQERGLNFPSEWDPHYQTVLECHDPGEEPHPGGELYLHYGKGAYIYTAYSWFRQLPAGVPGAYRAFANLLSAGKAQPQ
jgi:LmbE family N-acetylglucosaminyl deacetylase